MTTRGWLLAATSALLAALAWGVPPDRLSTASAGPVTRPAREQDAWKPLWNGKDLAGWETWLGRPHAQIDVPGHPRNDQGAYVGAVGLNKDPKAVYSVVQVDGKPAIRISGEIWGALTTAAEYENYHLRFEFKWGEKQWPPRATTVRDSGVLYHCVGPHGAGSGFWMRSFESQIQQKDCGDFFSVDGVIVDVEAVRRDPANPRSPLVYQPGAPKMIGVTQRIIKDPDNEKPTGEWNTMEILCVGQTSVHLVNGKPNMILTGLRHKVDGQEVPLTKGKIQFQSEGAEVFYRGIELRPLREIPVQYHTRTL